MFHILELQFLQCFRRWKKEVKYGVGQLVRFLLQQEPIFCQYVFKFWQIGSISKPNKLLAVPVCNKPTDVHTTDTGLI